MKKNTPNINITTNKADIASKKSSRFFMPASPHRSAEQEAQEEEERGQGNGRRDQHRHEHPVEALEQFQPQLKVPLRQ